MGKYIIRRTDNPKQLKQTDKIGAFFGLGS